MRFDESGELSFDVARREAVLNELMCIDAYDYAPDGSKLAEVGDPGLTEE